MQQYLNLGGEKYEIKSMDFKKDDKPRSKRSRKCTKQIKKKKRIREN